MHVEVIVYGLDNHQVAVGKYAPRGLDLTLYDNDGLELGSIKGDTVYDAYRNAVGSVEPFGFITDQSDSRVGMVQYDHTTGNATMFHYTRSLVSGVQSELGAKVGSVASVGRDHTADITRAVGGAAFLLILR